MRLWNDLRRAGGSGGTRRFPQPPRPTAAMRIEDVRLELGRALGAARHDMSRAVAGVHGRPGRRHRTRVRGTRGPPSAPPPGVGAAGERDLPRAHATEAPNAGHETWCRVHDRARRRPRTRASVAGMKFENAWCRRARFTTHQKRGHGLGGHHFADVVARDCADWAHGGPSSERPPPPSPLVLKTV